MATRGTAATGTGVAAGPFLRRNTRRILIKLAGIDETGNGACLTDEIFPQRHEGVSDEPD